jgi:F-type H+-transporting ATPase subunit epsilon
MAVLYQLSIVTPSAVKFEGDVELVVAPGAAGDLGVLANHAPLLTTLRTGVVSIKRATSADAAADTARVQFAIDRGFLQAFANSAVILTDVALAPDEIDAEEARADLRRAEEALAQKRGHDDAAERSAAAWARARLALTARPV